MEVEDESDEFDLKLVLRFAVHFFIQYFVIFNWLSFSHLCL